MARGRGAFPTLEGEASLPGPEREEIRSPRASLRAAARRLARTPARRALERRAGDARARRVLEEELHAPLSARGRRTPPPGGAQPGRAAAHRRAPRPRRARGEVRSRRGGGEARRIA